MKGLCCVAPKRKKLEEWGGMAQLNCSHRSPAAHLGRDLVRVANVLVRLGGDVRAPHVLDQPDAASMIRHQEPRKAPRAGTEKMLFDTTERIRHFVTLFRVYT